MELKRVGLSVLGERPEPKPVEMPDLPADTPLEERVKAALRTVFDPELPVNIYDLGLIYKVAVSNESDVAIDMTLTSPACPVAGSLVGEVQRKVAALPQVKSSRVELVWDPPWDKSRMSEEVALELGLM
jgi:FeS assembly SUF system protein